jgi:hypothetical protein
MHLPRLVKILIVAAPLWAALAPVSRPQAPSPSGLTEAQRLFYSGKYKEAAAVVAPLRLSDVPANALAAYELHSSALHFQIRDLLGEGKDRQKALRACGPCAGLLRELEADVVTGRATAATRLAVAPNDVQARYYQAKLMLNRLWLQNGTLGRRTGLGDYRAARADLDRVLQRVPGHIRARVARAWIDYFVDSRVPWGFKWVFGGGDRKKAITALQAAEAEASDPFDKAEAGFGLWNALVREQRTADARVVAERLYTTFPDNGELKKFLGR